MTATLPPALVLAAGLGTRLRPLTFCRAKAAVPVAGVPLICRHLTRLAARGVRDVVVNLHHRPNTITGVVGDGAALGCRVRYSWERVLLGSAGGPRRAPPGFHWGHFLTFSHLFSFLIHMRWDYKTLRKYGKRKKAIDSQQHPPGKREVGQRE